MQRALIMMRQTPDAARHSSRRERDLLLPSKNARHKSQPLQPPPHMSPPPDPDITVQPPLQEIDPRIQRDIDVVLAGGRVVKSYAGTSQYAQRGISACGLASCNAVRRILDLEREGVTGIELVQRMMSQTLVEVSFITF